LTKEAVKPTAVNPNLPPAIESIVLHAIEKDRNRRFQNMQEFLAAVEDPEAHAAQWNALPGYAQAAAVAPTMQRMPAVSAPSATAPRNENGAPRPTTLEGAAAEVTLPPTKRPRGRTPMIAVAAALLALAGVGGWLGLSKRSEPPSTTQSAASVVSPPATTEAPKPVTPPPAGDEVTVVVASDPLGAKVQRADKSEPEAQPTPITFKMHRGDPPFDIQLRLDGYLPQTRTVASDESVTLRVSLAKIPAAAPKPEVKVEAPKPAALAVSNVTKPKHATPKTAPKSTAPKSTRKNTPETDPDGIIQPSFGN
jgi:hypothetical protein